MHASAAALMSSSALCLYSVSGFELYPFATGRDQWRHMSVSLQKVSFSYSFATEKMGLFKVSPETVPLDDLNYSENRRWA